MEILRQTIGDQVRALTGADDGAIDLNRPVGDDGLFGPTSVSWKVHGDFTSMMIGGTAALMLQMLHPLALAGVRDHSDYKRDMLGRLKRTAQFIAATTYGSTAEAERLIARVRTIHDRVHGTLPDGTPYDANDPALLTWIHVAEVKMFLAAYLRYRNSTLPGEAQDRYYAEYAEVARRLGARNVPSSRREVDAYLSAMRPQLVFDEHTRTVLSALQKQPAPNLTMQGFGDLTMRAAADLLPPWARTKLQLRSGAEAPLVRAGMRGVGRVLRWALATQTAEAEARAV